MKKKIFSILLSLAMVITMMPAQTLVVSAVTKTKATVSTQTGLKKALKNKKLKTLTVKTSKVKTFSVKKGTHKKVHMIIDASKSTVKNNAVFKKITIRKSKTLVMNTTKGDIAVSKGGKVNEVKLTKGNSKINFNVSGELKKINIQKKSEISIKGSTKKTIAINAGENSDDTVIKTSVKVNAKIGSNAEVKLFDGSEGSSIAVTNKDVKVTVVNNTDASYTATDANGKPVEIEKDETVVIGGNTPSPTPIPSPTPTPESQKTFKAVYNTNDSNTLTFYYDSKDYSGENITVYDNLTTEAESVNDWAYFEVTGNIKGVIIDSTVENYHGLTSTAGMFGYMSNADSISGAEHLDVSNVTNMNGMFYYYGYNSNELKSAPNVSDWNTEKVTDMGEMFLGYGYKSRALNAVPDVSGWKTEKVTSMVSMFSGYGYSSTALNDVPDVSDWNTKNATDVSCMFSNYGFSSDVLNFTLNLSNWNTAQVTDFEDMFAGAGSAITDTSSWSVTIPAKTVEQDNDATHWYVGNGTDTTKYIAPAEGKRFTLSGACLAAGTMITMENGSRQAVETLEVGDMIKTFDHETGEISTAPICASWTIEDCQGNFTLHFTDNIDVSVVQEHCFFDRDTNRYEVITYQNASEYVGHYFYNADEDKWEKLLSVDFSEEPVTAYYIFTAKHYNHFAEGMLSLDPLDDGVMTYVFDFGENLKFDEDKMIADIEKYGLMTLEEMPYVPKEYFDALNMQYLKIAYGKGLAEKETIEEMIRYYIAQYN